MKLDIWRFKLKCSKMKNKNKKKNIISSGCLLAYLQQTQLIWFTCSSILVPATIGICHTTETGVITSGTHCQIDLFNRIIRRQIQGSCFLAYTHFPNRFIVCHLKDIQQIGMSMTIAYKLYNFIYAASGCANEVH